MSVVWTVRRCVSRFEHRFPQVLHVLRLVEIGLRNKQFNPKSDSRVCHGFKHNKDLTWDPGCQSEGTQQGEGCDVLEKILRRLLRIYASTSI